jgi:ribosomal protein S18 acetylase RimI-like enzyme
VTIGIRPARPGDEAGVAAVHIRGWQVGYRGLLPDEGLDQLDPVARSRRYSFDTADPQTFVAVIDAVIAGFVTVGSARGTDRHEAELYAIYVDPEHWGQGVGRALIAAGRGRLAEQGFTEVRLWILAGNERAERFYRADGWMPDGEVKADWIFGQEVEEVRFVRRL